MMRIAVFLAFGLVPGLLQAASAQAKLNHSEAISSHSSLSRASEAQGSAYQPLTVVAAAMRVSSETAVQARSQNLEEALSWVIMLMAKRCACPVSELMQRRKAMSWGQVAASAGYDWAELLEEARLRAEAAGIEPGLATAEQITRSISNDPAPSTGKSGVKP
jgi:hypothetical protein